ncbi:MAG: hypothetical protein QOF12_1471 [Solirubrobacteraceae bacterium]|jgi:hypothetical protein|nr:hypothetical protein [Solirubrobacteraceae bacterium]
MRWACERCGLPGGEKTYPSAEDATRYARAFNREDRSNTGKHPTLSTLPLWVAHKLRGDREARP